MRYLDIECYLLIIGYFSIHQYIRCGDDFVSIDNHSLFLTSLFKTLHNLFS